VRPPQARGAVLCAQGVGRGLPGQGGAGGVRCRPRCLTTPPHLPAGCLLGLRPPLLTPPQTIHTFNRQVEAHHGDGKSAFLSLPKVRTKELEDAFMLRHDRWLQRALWLRVPPHLPAWWLPPTPQAAPTHRRAPPEQLGGSLRPQQLASARSKSGECPPQALCGRGDVPHTRVARQVARLAPPQPCSTHADIRVPFALRIAVGGARRA
jgi:hypothetical protein